MYRDGKHLIKWCAPAPHPTNKFLLEVALYLRNAAPLSVLWISWRRRVLPLELPSLLLLPSSSPSQSHQIRLPFLPRPLSGDAERPAAAAPATTPTPPAKIESMKERKFRIQREQEAAAALEKATSAAERAAEKARAAKAARAAVAAAAATQTTGEASHRVQQRKDTPPAATPANQSQQLQQKGASAPGGHQAITQEEMPFYRAWLHSNPIVSYINKNPAALSFAVF